MIKVFFQSISGSHSELVATFDTEQLYMACLPALEKQAEEQRCFVTEIMSELDMQEAVASETQAVGFSCLSWHLEDFDGDAEAMDDFFRNHNDLIIENINNLIQSKY